MANKMLIDASHPEETRVVVTRGNRIEEFDFESQDKKQLKGNIYLARVTRVEPSLQAAFVEYGGNRHGFLAFSEIHPDYYQIPVADRQALLRDEAEAARREDEDEEDEQSGRSNARGRGRRRRGRGSDKVAKARASDVKKDDGETEEDPAQVAALAANADANVVSEDTDQPAPQFGDAVDLQEPDTHGDAADHDEDGADASDDDEDNDGDDAHGEDDANGEGEEAGVEMVGAEDAMDEAASRRRAPRRNYKIQEVIKRRQILLVQVVKEERGNKGAALTTYLSLAGRYSVLMPNTARGGGISRKITNMTDRKRLKDIVKDLEVPEGMGVILRTAGANRTKPEIKRDYEYLMRMWEQVRNLTLQSTAPSLVYEEGSLIKRSVRDLYNKDIDEILVAGDGGYREAKDFMRMLMPSHAKVVQPYRDPTPMYVRYGVEAQLDRMLQPQVTLKSGGYLIINQTEALVAIDVNSGRSTKEHSIEDTALQTNLEAAEEVARQLRLRDMAGLIVIDFIDMEEKRNNRSVEKRLKDCLRNDRARIQVGRISPFGLLEMSRQRIRASVLESTMQTCPHCGGTGHVRSDSSVALYVLRTIEEYLTKDARNNITVRTPIATALYILNQKRANLMDLESRFGLTVTVEGDDTVGMKLVEIDRGSAAAGTPSAPVPALAPDLSEEDAVDEALAEETAPEAEETGEKDDDGGRKTRRRRRRRRGGRDRDGDTQQAEGDDADADGDDGTEAGDGEAADASGEDAGDEDEGERKKRRRGKRGGRRNRRDSQEAETTESDSEGVLAEPETGDAPAQAETRAGAEGETGDGEAVEAVDAEAAAAVEGAAASAETTPEAAPEEAPAKPKRRSRAKKAKTEEAGDADSKAAEAAAEEKPKPKRRSRKKADAEPKAADEATAEVSPSVEAAAEMATAARSDDAAQPEAKGEDAEGGKDTPQADADDASGTSADGVSETEAETTTGEAAEAAGDDAAAADRSARTAPVASEPVVTSANQESGETKPRKAGWWQRKGFF
ncbi:MAG: ribonuclease E/G [Zhengella sp.]|uniref:Rne/Rng family ribonuclease n=1 Tax=Zhengella sp. TaxID=2282762 RepID=UPI003527CBBA